ncbi:S-layer homology domain-containing protein [Pseudoflavonifractor sp. DSM 107456]|uniref:S-layer homology domain-containing protein n=1 Tax=Pseudoflavonifractor gallinarum TaxID=2779352 RepID=A0ABR9RDT9_9FIRM|nr:S-layer homology domain-containing protein [Pseudoflavonifractor gallinarum]MBE5056856.1 S-layer homology domain-containing protein [Pseudoflavonifractor gallinarum]
MKGNWKHTRFRDRLVSGILTVVMLTGLLPTAAYAALWDNTPDQNQEILESLTEFWGDEKTAKEAMELLRTYGLIDEEGNVLTDWSGTMTIQEKGRSLTIAEARTMSENNVTVNGRACESTELKAVLETMEKLGLLVGDVPAAEWQLQVDGQSVAPAGLAAALSEDETPAVTVLGTAVDSADVLAVIDFLDQYGLLTDTGARSEWDIILPDGERKTDLTELLAMLERGNYDPAMVITVDGTPITMADFKTMMDIQKEVERIRSTYFPEGGVDWTEEQLESLYDLYLQLQNEGITLYNTQGADGLVFPSGIDQNAAISVSLDKTSVSAVAGGSVTATYTVTGAEEDQDISFEVSVLPASAAGLVTSKTYPVEITGNGTGTVTIPVGKLSSQWTDDTWKGEKTFYLYASNVKNAAFAGGALSHTQAVKVTNEINFQTLISESAKNTSRTVNFTDAQKYFLRNQASHMDWSVSVSGNKSTVFTQTEENPGWSEYHLYYQYLKSGAYLGDKQLVGTELGYTQRGSTLKNKDAADFYNLILGGNASSQLPLVSGSTASTPVKNTGSQNTAIPAALKTADSITLQSTGICDHVKSSWVYSSFPYYYGLEATDGTFDATTTVTIKDTQAPKVTGVAFPEETFSMGAQAPITVTFSEPVQSSGVQLTADGKELSAQEQNTVSKTLTFLYPVETVGQQRISVAKISGAKDAAGNAMAADTTSRTSDQILDTITILEALKRQPGHEAEVTDLTYEPAQGDQPEKTTATVNVTIDLPLKNYEDTTPDDQLTQEQKTNKDLRNLLLDSYTLDSGFASGKVAASIDGGDTLIPLVLDNGTSPASMTATVEIDASELAGFDGDAKSFVMEFYQISVDKENGNTVSAGDLLFGYYTAFSVKPPVPLTGENLAIETPEGWQDTIYVNDPPADEALMLTGKVSGSGYTWTQTRWVSDDETIASIDAQGVIHPLKAGTVTFYLEAVNGNLEEYQGEDYRSEGITLTVQEGAEPYLRIPESQITLRSGDPLTLRWASNLAQKNREFGMTEEEKKTSFTIAVYPGDKTQGQAVKTYTVTYDPSTPDGTLEMGNGTTAPMWTMGEDGTMTPNQSFLIPGLDDTKDGYTIVLSVQAAKGVPGVSAEERTFKAQTRVTVTAQPVSVALARPQRLFVTNEGSLTIPYTLANFDAEGGGGAFKLTVTDNATGKTIVNTTDYKAYGDVAGGSFVLDLGGVRPNDGFRTIYDVSLQAKNTTAGQDWSRDSFTLYIYDKSALDILVQPVSRNGVSTVDVKGNTITMSNEDWIASLSQDEILALNRDINLQTAISINYGDHAWGEASDRIRWVVENSEAATVNYPQGAYYENIEGLPYSSYAPATQFLLSGKNDGKTVVQAIHDLAGDALGSSVEITVETLKDKLYLFQFYPAVSGLTMTYTNGAGEEKTATSDDQGRFAIYEASGIASDVYVQGMVDDEVYLGTVYQNRLVTQEKDAVSLELYPLNSLTLRKVATLPLYLKTPDGADYSGEATVRVGVYRNGEYCPDARYSLKKEQAAALPGDQDQKVTFQDGKATFYFDVTQFNTNNGEDPITAADNIEFAVEIRTGETYYPIFFSASGTTNESDAIRMGERILNLEKVPAGQENQPFAAQQTLYFSGKESGLSADLRGRAGKVGPSADYPDPLLSTVVLWWGEKGTDTDPDTKRSAYYTDSRDNKLTEQEIVNDRYPFASMPVTTVLTPMDQKQVEYLKIEDLRGRGIQLHYVGADGKEPKSETMSWSFFNALKLEKATGSAALPEELKSLANISSAADGSMFQSLVNDFIGAGITLATQVGLDLPFLQLKLVPTEDPTVFRGIVYVGLNNIQGDNVTGIDADTTARDYDLDPTPGLEQIKGLYRQGLAYGKTMANQVKMAAKILEANIKQGGGTSKTGDRKTYYALNGGFETEVYFDFTANRWKMVVMNGGLQAGGGMGYEWTWNTQAGPVPLLAQLELGASAIVDFNAAVDNVAKDTDYLTQFYIYSYMQAFGGFGFDYAVIALKLGMFGQISMNAQLQWLNSFRNGEHFGWSVDVRGSVGMKFQVELLFISYESILWSQPINVYSGTGDDWDMINDYWEQVGNGTSGSEIIWPDGTSGRLLMSAGNGMGIYEADLEPKLLERDYLSQYPRTYDRSGPEESSGFLNAIGDFFTGGSEAESTIRTEVIGNAYPQAAPVLSDDGAWMFYLDDMGNGSDATVVRVKAASQSGEGYDARAAKALSDEGYGDSGLKAAGSGEYAVAVWSRITERPATTEPGSSVTGDVQAGMMNSSEIMVAVRNGSGWNVSYLTGNRDESGAVTSDGMADLAPVVATNGERILVAWRQVASSQTDAITTFDTKDYIMYAVSEDQGETWTQPQPIYNGTSGSVKGIEAAMLDSGEAAVVFTLQTGEHNVRTGDFQQEVVYAVIDKPAQGEAELLADGTPAEYQVVRYVQLTDDEAMDENPQIAAVKLKNSDEQESFVIGWSSTSGVNENQENDIRLAAVDADGNRVIGFVDSLSHLTANTGVRINANFRFSRNADTLDELSILWKESVVESNEDSATQTEQTTTANRDYLSGLRFRTDDMGNLSVTAAQRVAQMDESTAIDHFDAYVDKSGKLISVLQGTFYDYENPETITMNPGTGSEYTVFLPAERTSVYLGSGSYTDTMRLDSVIPDYLNIKKGMSIPVQLSVTNLGTQPMDKVQVTIGTSTTTFEAGAQESSFVSIAPGETRALTVFYTVPADGIPNPTYTVTGTFQSGVTSETEGVLTLNIPDLGIAGNETLLEAKDGQRVLQFTLYNNSDAELAGSGRKVKFNLYSDSACTQPIPAQYFQEIVTRSDGEDALKIIDGSDLAKIDEGYYTVQYRFDLAEYIKQTNEEGKALYADEAGEVRDGGITLYAKAWVETTDENGDGEMLEAVSSNNIAAVQVESLLKQAGGEHVTTSQQLTQTPDGGTVVTVTLNNNSIVNSESGNVVVRLYDEQGNVVDVQQSYTTAQDLITLAPEERKTLTFSSDKTGVRAEVSYGDLVLDQADATLKDLKLSGVATLQDFTQQADGSYAASVIVSQVASTVVTAMTADPGATVTVNGQPLGLEGVTLALSSGKNILTIEVTSGSEKQTYTLAVQNNYPAGGSSGNLYTVTVPENTEHGTVSVTPDKARSGQTVTITAKADEGYQVGTVTVVRANGNAVAVQDRGDGIYTFTMPDEAVELKVTFVEASGWTNPFSDVSADAWYYDAVRYVSENGLMSGYGADRFGPDDDLTRAQLAQILYNLEGKPSLEGENLGYPFTDVPGDAWFADAVYWARLHGIVSGYSDEQFGADDNLTREQLAVMLYRYAQYKGYDTAADNDLTDFPDQSAVAVWSREGVEWAVGNGLISGMGDGTLSPQGNASRGQIAAILMRFAQNVMQ